MINIDYYIFLRDLIPPSRRQTKTIDWLSILFNEIQDEHDWLQDYYDETMFEIRHNSQRLTLEDYLNSLGPSYGVIRLEKNIYPTTEYNWMIEDYLTSKEEVFVYFADEDIFRTEQVFTFFDGEESSVYFDETFLYFDSEYYTDEYDYVVLMQKNDYDNTTFKNLVMKKAEQYKLAGLTIKYDYYI